MLFIESQAYTSKVAFTYDESMFSTHCDDCLVDDPKQRYHNVLNMLKCFPLKKKSRHRQLWKKIPEWQKGMNRKNRQILKNLSKLNVQ